MTTGPTANALPRVVQIGFHKCGTRSLEQLVREKTELQDNLASLGLMIGSISHGIKGMLTGLNGGMYMG